MQSKLQQRRPSVFKPIIISPIIKGIIDRRLRAATVDKRKQVFGFNEFGTRVWISTDTALILIGESAFLKRSEQIFKQAGHPLPFLIDKDFKQGVAFAVVEDTRICHARNITLANLDQGFVLSGISSILLNKITATNVSGYNFDVQCVIAFYSEKNFIIESFYEDFELLLTRELSFDISASYAS